MGINHELNYVSLVMHVPEVLFVKNFPTCTERFISSKSSKNENSLYKREIEICYVLDCSGVCLVLYFLSRLSLRIPPDIKNSFFSAYISYS